jgi:hypothetical protein
VSAYDNVPGERERTIESEIDEVCLFTVVRRFGERRAVWEALHSAGGAFGMVDPAKIQEAYEKLARERKRRVKVRVNR